MVFSRPVLVVQMPNQPSSDYQHIPRSIILMAKNPEPMVPSLRSWPLWSAHSRVLLVLEQDAHVHAWLRALWQWTRAVDVVAMVLTPISPEFFTWFPYQSKECSNVINVIRLNSSSLYPPKIGQFLNDCPLVAVTSRLPPLVVDDFRGIEPRLYQTLALKLGLNASYVTLHKGLYVWTHFNLKGEPINGMKLLWENQVDVMFSLANLNYHSARFADFLTTHGMNKDAWFVPGPLPASHATAIYRAFHPLAWACVLTACFVIFVTTTLIRYFETRRWHNALICTLAITLSLPPTMPQSSKYLPIFAVGAYLYSMHITTAYQASLILYLSDIPREKPIRTLEDLANSEFMVEFHEVARDIMAESVSPLVQVILNSGRALFTPYLHIETFTGDSNRIALLGPELPFSFIMTTRDEYYDQYGYPRFRIFPEMSGAKAVCFYVSKGHPLHHKLDHHMLQLIEAGMPQHYAAELMVFPRQRLPHLEPFSVGHVTGPFLLFLTMILMSFVVWLIELLMHYVWKTNVINKKAGNSKLCR